MKILKITAVVVLVLAAGLAVVAPVGPLPGFFIGGSLTPSPAQWPDTSATHEIKLRVPGTPPRVVIIWVVEHDGELHVVGARDGGWAGMIGRGGPVQMRLGENTYTLEATLLGEGWQPVYQAWIEKYRPDYPEIVADFPSIDEADSLIAVFRLNRV